MTIECSVTRGPAMKLLPDGLTFVNKIEELVGSKAELTLVDTKANGSHLYYLSNLVTSPDFLKKGLATGLLQRINKFLEEKNTMGLLVNITNMDGNESEIYSRNGWKKWQKRIYIYQPTGVSDRQVNETASVFIDENQQRVVEALAASKGSKIG
jgi:hypothetical protein